jgi:hypothetical protein
MSRVSRADWAPPTKWADIPDKPPFADGPGGNITIDDVQGLVAALAGKQNAGGLARVATTGSYTDLNSTPAFGSAAFANVSDFAPAPVARQLQVGSVPFVATQQKYSVVFSVTMDDVPKVKTQVFMADDNGELFSAVIPDDSLTSTGFSFFLTGAPSGATGRLEYTARVESTP